MRNRVYLDPRTKWWIADYSDIHGRRHRARAALTKTLALQVLHKRLQDIAQEKAGNKPALADIRLEQLAERFKSWARAHKKPKAARRYESSLSMLLPRFGKLSLSAVTHEAVERYMTDRRGDGRKPATVNRDVAALKRMFSKAVEWGLAADSPLRRVKLLPENNVRVRYLSDEEREALLAHCQGHLLDIVNIALHTGMRQGEILNLKWQDMDLGRRQIIVRDTKNGETRHVPVSPPLLTIMRQIRRQPGQPWLFPNHEGKPIQDISTAWENAVEAAGIEGFRFHDLRHTFASYYVMSGGDLNPLRVILGHKSLTMTLRYAHLAPEHLHAGVDRMALKMADGSLLPKPEGTQRAQEREAI